MGPPKKGHLIPTQMDHDPEVQNYYLSERC